MNPFKWFLERRKEKKEDRAEIERAEREQLRAGEDRPESQDEIVEDAISRFPSD